MNGSEAISLQVNVKLKEPEKTEQLLFNANDLGKFDLKLNALAASARSGARCCCCTPTTSATGVDRHKDGFLDLPLATQFNAFNKWKYLSGHGLVSEVGLGALHETRQGGQRDFRNTGEAAFTQHYGTTQARNTRPKPPRNTPAQQLGHAGLQAPGGVCGASRTSPTTASLTLSKVQPIPSARRSMPQWCGAQCTAG